MHRQAYLWGLNMSSENKSSNRILIMGYLLIAGFAVILVRLWQLQVLQGSSFRKISESNRLRVIGVPAPRGIIYDRNKIPLVKNVPYFCASLIPSEFNNADLPSLAKLLNVGEAELENKIHRTE